MLRMTSNMLIKKIADKDDIPYRLLLLADETTQAIDKHIHDSDTRIINQSLAI